MLYILGCGGLAHEIGAVASQSTSIKYVDLADEDELLKSRDCFECIIGVGFPYLREKIANKFESGRFFFKKIIHSKAVIDDIDTVRIDLGCYVAANALFTTNIEIQANSLINFGVTIGHGVRVGKCCVINPGVCLSGNVTIGDCSMIGVGAVIRENLTVGKNSIVGMGSVVTHHVPDNTIVFGNPAIIVRKNV